MPYITFSKLPADRQILKSFVVLTDYLNSYICLSGKLSGDHDFVESALKVFSALTDTDMFFTGNLSISFDIAAEGLPAFYIAGQCCNPSYINKYFLNRMPGGGMNELPVLRERVLRSWKGTI